MTTNNNEIGARRFVIVGLMMFGLLIASTPSHALSVAVGSTVIADDGSGDTCGSSPGIICFSNLGVPGAYNIISGTLVKSGSTFTLTNLDIEALAASVSGGISFSDNVLFAAPAVGSVTLDGNWTSGPSNAPAAISGGSIYFSNWATGDYMWNGGNTIGYQGVEVASASGSTFGPLTNSGSMNFPCYGETLGSGTGICFFAPLTVYSPTFSAVGGTLSFSLAAAGDGIWLPGSAEITVSSVPLPGAVWLLTSGLAGLAGLFGFTRRNARPA